MDKAAEVESIKKDAEALNMKPRALCRAAGVDESTWWRARKNPDKVEEATLKALKRAIVVAQRQAAKA